MKRSPYFFMRQQASKRLQSYLSLGFVLLVVAGGIGYYGWLSPTDTTSRMALLSNKKPADAEIQEVTAASAAASAAARKAATAEPVATQSDIASLLIGEDAPTANPELPADFDQFDPNAELKTTTELSQLALSTEVTDDYNPVTPGRVFAEGFYTLYATFDYADMADGMEWAWVWRHNGEVIDGGNELWSYGDEGPGYIYLSPEEGFGEGRYTLEVWVNGELLGQTAATMNDAAVAAGN